MTIFYDNDLEYLSTKEAWIQEGIWAEDIHKAYEEVENGATFVGFDLPLDDEEKEVLNSIIVTGLKVGFDFNKNKFQELLESMGNNEILSNKATNISDKLFKSFLDATNKSYNNDVIKDSVDILSVVAEGSKSTNRMGDWHTDEANSLRVVMNLQGSGTIFCKLITNGAENINEINNFMYSIYSTPLHNGGYSLEELSQHHKLCSESKGHKIFQVPTFSGAFFKMDTAVHAFPVMNASDTRIHFSFN